METSNSTRKNGSDRKAVIIVALALLTCGGLGTALYMHGVNSDLTFSLNEGKLKNERLLAEKLQLEKSVLELGRRYNEQDELLTNAQGEGAKLRKQVAEAIARSKNLEGAAQKSKNLGKEVASLRELKARLEEQLRNGTANENALQAKLDKMTSERDALTAQLNERSAGAEMVNNAAVDALRGKKGKLTVVARRTKEVRMAFDLPQKLAPGASFTIITPDGHKYGANDPAISFTTETIEAEPTASLDAMPVLNLGERSARIHLKFNPKEKLKPGSYRIDVLSGDIYLNTVLLNLR